MFIRLLAPGYRWHIRLGSLHEQLRSFLCVEYVVHAPERETLIASRLTLALQTD